MWPSTELQMRDLTRSEHCSPGIFPRRVLLQNLLEQRKLSDLTLKRRNPSFLVLAITLP